MTTTVADAAGSCSGSVAAADGFSAAGTGDSVTTP